MRDITDIVMRYRECARSVYNSYFRDWGDGSHDFINVDNELFSALVLCRLSKWPAGFKWHDPAEFIRVNYGKVENGLEVHRLSGRRGKELNIYDWSEWILKDDSTELTFVKFFDFSNIWDFKDYSLVECQVSSANADTGLMVGDRLLLEAQRVTFEELTERLGGGQDAAWLASEKAKQRSEIE
jgi:hypothetical protein